MRMIYRSMPIAVSMFFMVGSIALGQLGGGSLVETRAEERVKIEFDPNVLPLSLKLIDEIVNDKEVAGAVARELSGKPVRLEEGGGFGGDFRRWVVEGSNAQYRASAASTSFPNTGDRSSGMFIKVQVGVVKASEVEDVKEAEKFARLIANRLDRVLAELSRREFARKLEQRKTGAEEAKKAGDIAAAKLEETRTNLNQRALSRLSIPVLEELVSSLKKQQQALEVDLAGMKGRAEALQVEIAKTAMRVKKEPADDEVVRNLQRVLELRMQHLRGLKQLSENGTITQLEAGKAEEAVAMVQVELAQAKRTISRSAVDQLDKLNGDLAQIAVNTAELEAKLKYVTDQLESNIAMLSEVRKAEPIHERIARETRAVDNLRLQAEQAAANVRQLESSFRPARVEIFDLDDSEAAKEQKGAATKKNS